MRRTLMISLIVVCAARAASGQGSDRPAEVVPPQRGAARGQDPNRAGLELQLRQNLARRARIELGLSPEQMVKLADVNRRFGVQQRAVDLRENQMRKALRQALLEAPTAEQDARVGDLNEQFMQLQRQHLDLIAAEQKELAGFMTNVQRVRFQGLQENFRRQLQDGPGLRGAPPGPRRGPPPDR